MLNVVVLPAPFGPSRPTISPALTFTETPLTTRRPRYSLASWSVASKVPAAELAAIFSRSELDWISLTPVSFQQVERRGIGFVAGTGRHFAQHLNIADMKDFVNVVPDHRLA